MNAVIALVAVHRGRGGGMVRVRGIDQHAARAECRSTFRSAPTPRSTKSRVTNSTSQATMATLARRRSFSSTTATARSWPSWPSGLAGSDAAADDHRVVGLDIHGRGADADVRPATVPGRTQPTRPTQRQSIRWCSNARRIRVLPRSVAYFLISQISDTWQPRPLSPRFGSRYHSGQLAVAGRLGGNVELDRPGRHGLAISG